MDIPLDSPFGDLRSVDRNFLQLEQSPVLRLPDLQRVAAKDLWLERPALVFVVRRAGCQFCRAQGILISHCKTILRRLGFDVVAVMPTEDDDIAEFKGTAWTGRLFIDKQRAFYTYLGDGELRRGSYWQMLTKQFWRLLARNKVQGVKGTLKTGGKDGNVLGGMLLIGTGHTGVVASWKEETFADFGDLADVVRKAYEISPNKDFVELEEIEKTIEEHRIRNESRLVLVCDWNPPATRDR